MELHNLLKKRLVTEGLIRKWAERHVTTLTQLKKFERLQLLAMIEMVLSGTAIAVGLVLIGAGFVWAFCGLFVGALFLFWMSDWHVDDQKLTRLLENITAIRHQLNIGAHVPLPSEERLLNLVDEALRHRAFCRGIAKHRFEEPGLSHDDRYRYSLDRKWAEAEFFNLLRIAEQFFEVTKSKDQYFSEGEEEACNELEKSLPTTKYVPPPTRWPHRFLN